MTDVPTIHITPEELKTDRFWHEKLAPIAAAHGLPEPIEMANDQSNPAQHLLLAPDGRLLAVVRTDRPACPTCGL
jgi:hypothetical protein